MFSRKLWLFLFCPFVFFSFFFLFAFVLLFFLFVFVFPSLKCQSWGAAYAAVRPYRRQIWYVTILTAPGVPTNCGGLSITHWSKVSSSTMHSTGSCSATLVWYFTTPLYQNEKEPMENEAFSRNKVLGAQNMMAKFHLHCIIMWKGMSFKTHICKDPPPPPQKKKKKKKNVLKTSIDPWRNVS